MIADLTASDATREKVFRLKKNAKPVPLEMGKQIAKLSFLFVCFFFLFFHEIPYSCMVAIKVREEKVFREYGGKFEEDGGQPGAHLNK